MLTMTIKTCDFFRHQSNVIYFIHLPNNPYMYDQEESQKNDIIRHGYAKTCKAKISDGHNEKCHATPYF